MSLDSFTGKVLIVDDESFMRHVLTREAKEAGVEDFELFEDAPSTVDRIENLDEPAAAIFSDGLNGGWRHVVAAARAANTPTFVVSGNDNLKQSVEAAGATFIDKSTGCEPGFIESALANLQHPTE